MLNICIMFVMFCSYVCKDILLIKEIPGNLDFELFTHYSSVLTFKDLDLHMKTQIEILFICLDNK